MKASIRILWRGTNEGWPWSPASHPYHKCLLCPWRSANICYDSMYQVWWCVLEEIGSVLVHGWQANWGDSWFSEWTRTMDVYRWCFGLDGVLLGGYSHNYSNFLNLISARPWFSFCSCCFYQGNLTLSLTQEGWHPEHCLGYIYTECSLPWEIRFQ